MHGSGIYTQFCVEGKLYNERLVGFFIEIRKSVERESGEVSRLYLPILNVNLTASCVENSGRDNKDWR